MGLDPPPPRLFHAAVQSVAFECATYPTPHPSYPQTLPRSGPVTGGVWLLLVLFSSSHPILRSGPVRWFLTAPPPLVISRWAKRKKSSQFRKELLNGSKSFIFSWNKKHGAIHEEALLHYFDPSKKVQKFEYQPKPKQPVGDSVIPSSCCKYQWEPVLPRSLLHYGRISYHLERLQLWDPTFSVPDHINQILFQQYHDTLETGVTIVRSIDGTLQWSVDPQLILKGLEVKVQRNKYRWQRNSHVKTRVRYGKVSFQESDVHFRHGTW